MTTEPRRAPTGAAVLRQDITAAIQAALIDELAAVGYGRLSIEGVSRRAGVSKTAVYRRWDSKLEMVVEVISRLAETKLPLPDTGSLSGDLVAVIGFLARALQHPVASQVIPDLLAEAARNPEIARTLQQVLRDNQREIGKLIVDRAAARGELAADSDPESAIELMCGAVYWRVAVARAVISRAYVEHMASTITRVLKTEAAK